MISVSASIHTRLLIIGSGPAGYTAAIYAARACLNPLLIEGIQPGGQLTITTEVENYPGFAQPVQGPELMELMRKQAQNLGVRILSEQVVTVNFLESPFKINTSNASYIADSVIICTGASAKQLGLKSEEFFQGYGVSGCATCDGFFFRGKEVVVIGGGNTAVEEALYLTNHVSKVTLIHRRDSLRAEKMLQERLFANSKISVIWNSVTTEILGQDNPKSVSGIAIRNVLTGEIRSLSCDGVFVAIGHNPNTDIFKEQILIDSEGYIITAPDSTKTSAPGIFAAGDVQDKIYRQAVTAAGTGCMAALEAEKFLSEKSYQNP
jgi:thioredoxin reductase (NADPH)